MATDSVHNLQNRARGAESVLLEVEGRSGTLDAQTIQHRLETVTGVSRVVLKESHDNRSVFEVESLKERSIRGDLARAVVEAGWNLNELRSAAMSLEEIFLQLTGAKRQRSLSPEEPVAARRQPMRNIWIICRKELHSYFVSPVAYLLLTMFAIIFGFFFWNSVGYFNARRLASADERPVHAHERERIRHPPAAVQHQRGRACSSFP